jgi:exonuclease VII large subunit
MKLFLPVLTIAVFIISCSQTAKQKVDENKLKTYFKSNVKKYDSTMTLETFTFVKLDTTTLKNQYYQFYNGILDKLDEDTYDFDRLLEKIKSNRKLQSLSSGLSYSLYKNYKDDADDDTKKAKDLLAADSLFRVDLNKIDTLLKSVDSIKPVAYLAKCFYTLKKQDQSITKDTTTIRLDLDFNILDKDEYSKQINKLYKPVSNFKYE